MKRVYWRPQKISKTALFVIGMIAVGGALMVERFPAKQDSSDRQTKLVAAQLANRGMTAIRVARQERGHSFDRRFDPGQTGLIGAAMSPVTSLPSHLDAKQTSVNPNFAAVVVELLDDAGVERGDLVAVGYTGSFPALNTCVGAALEAMGAEPIVIHSAASSQFGANVPDFMWLDMEQELRDQGIISYRTCAATLGGFGDRGRGMSDESKELLTASLNRHQVPLMKIERLSDSIESRMRTYEREAAGRPIAAYINVGGGAASIHGADGRDAFGPGLTKQLPTQDDIDCVATRMAAAGTPVIHMGNVVALAKSYDLPIAPIEMPTVGEGGVFSRTRPNRLLAGAVLLVVLGMVRVYVWTDWWNRIAFGLREILGKPAEEIKIYAEPMV